MKPQDTVALVLAASVLLHPIVTIAALALWGRSLQQIGGETLEAIQVATLAVLAGYLTKS
jgi:hypothetical protein